MLPNIPSRVEKGRNRAGFWIDPSQIRTLEPVTKTARQREVFQRGLAAVLPRDDVVKMERQFGAALGKTTVFTAMTGPVPNRPLRRPIHP